MPAKRIVFTGGTGKAGRHAVPYLKGKGYEILNVDLKPLDCPGVNTLIADLAESGRDAVSRKVNGADQCAVWRIGGVSWDRTQPEGQAGQARRDRKSEPTS